MVHCANPAAGEAVFTSHSEAGDCEKKRHNVVIRNWLNQCTNSMHCPSELQQKSSQTLKEQ